MGLILYRREPTETDLVPSKTKAKADPGSDPDPKSPKPDPASAGIDPATITAIQKQLYEGLNTQLKNIVTEVKKPTNATNMESFQDELLGQINKMANVMSKELDKKSAADNKTQSEPLPTNSEDQLEPLPEESPDNPVPNLKNPESHEPSLNTHANPEKINRMAVIPNDFPDDSSESTVEPQVSNDTLDMDSMNDNDKNSSEFQQEMNELKNEMTKMKQELKVNQPTATTVVNGRKIN